MIWARIQEFTEKIRYFEISSVYNTIILGYVMLSCHIRSME
jgi:hypothetical protein